MNQKYLSYEVSDDSSISDKFTNNRITQNCNISPNSKSGKWSKEEVNIIKLG
jgi:hypothetical protein